MTEQDPKQTHAYLERFHYQAVRESPEYREELRQSLIAETISMYLPFQSVPDTTQDVPQPPPAPPDWLKETNLLKRQLRFLQNKIGKIEDDKKKRTSKYT